MCLSKVQVDGLSFSSQFQVCSSTWTFLAPVILLHCKVPTYRTMCKLLNPYSSTMLQRWISSIPHLLRVTSWIPLLRPALHRVPAAGCKRSHIKAESPWAYWPLNHVSWLSKLQKLLRMLTPVFPKPIQQATEISVKGYIQARNQGGARGSKPPENNFCSPWKNLLDIVWKIWAPLRKLFALLEKCVGYGPGCTSFLVSFSATLAAFFFHLWRTL